jgi:outer membrane immunogenic protein
MKLALPAALILLAAPLAAPAYAADLGQRPYTKAPIVDPAFNWSGFYLGGQIGYAWRSDDHTERDLTGPDGFRASSKPTGGVAGLHAGYNWQAGNFLLGVEGDIEGADIKGSGNYVDGTGNVTSDRIDTRTDWQASLRGRLGFTANNWLIYATGGAAWANINHDYVSGSGSGHTETSSTTRPGWTAGAGFEYGFASNWSARLEYRYTDYGTLTNISTQFTSFQDHKITENTVRAGVSYHFNSGAVAARY